MGVYRLFPIKAPPSPRAPSPGPNFGSPPPRPAHPPPPRNWNRKQPDGWPADYHPPTSSIDPCCTSAYLPALAFPAYATHARCSAKCSRGTPAAGYTLEGMVLCFHEASLVSGTGRTRMWVLVCVSAFSCLKPMCLTVSAVSWSCLAASRAEPNQP